MRNDEEVTNNNEPCKDKEEDLKEDNEIAEIFRIETDIFDYESPICKSFDEFSYLFQVDPDVLTKDILGFKTYEYDLKDEALRSKAALEESMNQEEESSNNAWSDYLPIDEWENQGDTTNMERDVNYNPYIDISRLFNEHATTKEE
nr:hypothetical protein [Tanacetum cinerariifolium]